MRFFSPKSQKTLNPGTDTRTLIAVRNGFGPGGPKEKTKMKKFITLLAVMAIGFAAIGCSKSEDAATGDAAAKPAAGADAAKTETPAAETK